MDWTNVITSTDFDLTDEQVTRFFNLHVLGNAQINDDKTLALGSSGVADAYIKYASATDNLTFYDRTTGAKTLAQLAAAGSPSLEAAFEGDPAITGAISSATAMTIGGATDSIAIWQEDANDMRILALTGSVLNLDADGGAINILSDTTKLGLGASGITDSYIYGDGSDIIFYSTALGQEVTLSELAGTGLTNPVVVGDITIADGKIELNSTTDETTSFTRTIAGSASVVGITQALAASTGPVLTLTQAGTGNAKGLVISHSGDYAAIDISAPVARTGDVIDIAMANQLAQKALSITGAWTGAATTGLIDLNSSGALAADASMLRILSSGAIAAANDGALVELVETGAAQATSYMLRIASTNNEALHVDTGKSLFDELATFSGGLVTMYSAAVNLTGTPTGAEFDGIFGVDAPAGFVGIAKDSGGTPVYLVASDGADYWYVALTKAL